MEVRTCSNDLSDTANITPKRTRKANYTREENHFLAGKLEEFRDILDAKQKDSFTNWKKKETWSKIMYQYQSRFPDMGRSLDEIKVRIFKMKSDLKRSSEEAKATESFFMNTPVHASVMDHHVQSSASLQNESPSREDTCINLNGKERNYDDDFQSQSGFQYKEASACTENDELMRINIGNALIKRENLLLEQEKLRLEVMLLKQQLKKEKTDEEFM